MDFVFESSLPAAYQDDLERLVFFNHGQGHSQDAIIQALELYGNPAIVSGPAGLRLVVSRRDDVQCLFALAPRRGEFGLAGMLMYVRVSREELVVLHIAVADRYSQRPRLGLSVVSALVRAVRGVAHQLRGVDRLTMLYLQGRQFHISLSPHATGRDRTASPEPDPLRLAPEVLHSGILAG